MLGNTLLNRQDCYVFHKIYLMSPKQQYTYVFDGPDPYATLRLSIFLKNVFPTVMFTVVQHCRIFPPSLFLAPIP